eukprot:Sspe_Gene.687::Locus_234_Transcript_1_5_Confidence_0.286_Length_775::g.687::m.687
MSVIVHAIVVALPLYIHAHPISPPGLEMEVVLAMPSVSCVVELHVEDTVGVLRERAATEMALPKEALQLFVGDDELKEDDALLSDSGLTAEGTVQVVVRPLTAQQRMQYASRLEGARLDVVDRVMRVCGSADRDLVLRAVGFDGWNLVHASPGLRGDREVVLRAL